MNGRMRLMLSSPANGVEVAYGSPEGARPCTMPPLARWMNSAMDPSEVSDLHAHLKDAEDLEFDCPEIDLLQTLASQSETIQAKARTSLRSTNAERDRDGYIQDCARLLLEGFSLNVNLNELYEVEEIVMRRQLIKELEEKLHEEHSVTLDEAQQLLMRARARQPST